jgi:heparan-sulfate lyase
MALVFVLAAGGLGVAAPAPLARAADDADSLAWLDRTRPELRAADDDDPADTRRALLTRLLTVYRRRFAKPAKPPAVSKGTQEVARLALEHRIRMFGRSEPYDLGRPVAWTRNPTDNIEFVYTLNRHGMIGALAAAYESTGDDRYAREAVGMMLDWIARVPPTEKAPWRELEVALRGHTWAVAVPKLVHADAMTPEALGTILASLAVQIETLVPEANWREGNHGVNASWGMMKVGVTFPELAASRRFTTLGWERINRHMEREVFDDGAQCELTAGYHVWCLDHFDDAFTWADEAGIRVAPAASRKLERMYEYVLTLVKPDDSLPILGDSEMSDGRGVMARGFRRFKRRDFEYIATGRKAGKPPAALDMALPDAGYFVTRSTWTDPNAIYAMLDVARHWGGWHAHFDALDLHLHAFGRNLLPEGGTISYVAGPRARSRATEAQNTVTIDGRNQSQAAAVLRAFASAPQACLIDGSHVGSPEATHRRQVLFVRPGSKAGSPAYFLVIDHVTGTGRHDVRQRFHLPPGEVVRDHTAGQDTARTAFPAGGNLEIRLLAAPPGARTTIEDGWMAKRGGSGQSGVTVTRPVVQTRFEGPLPATLVTLLVPYDAARRPALEAHVDWPDRTAAGTVTVRDGTFTDTLDWAGIGPDGSAAPAAIVTITRQLDGRRSWRVPLGPDRPRSEK